MPKVKFFNKKTGRTEEREQTPEEITTSRERKQEGQAFIQKREKLASQMGISSKQAGRRLIEEEQKPIELKTKEEVKQKAFKTSIIPQIFPEPEKPAAEKGFLQKEAEALIEETLPVGLGGKPFAATERLLTRPKEEIARQAVRGAAAAGIGAAATMSVPAITFSIGSKLAAGSTGFLGNAIKWGAGLFTLGTIANIPEKKIADIAAEMGTRKTGLTSELKLLNAAGPLAVPDVLNRLDQTELALNEYERKIKQLNNASYTSQLFGYGKYGETQLEIENTRRYIQRIRFQAELIRQTGQTDINELLLLMQNEFSEI